MKIYANELIKIFRKRRFLLFLVIMLFLNVFFMYSSQIKGTEPEFISAKEKNALYNDIANLSDSEKLSFINQKYELLYEENNKYYTQNSYTERQLLDNTENYINVVDNYDEYLQQILDKSENMSGISLFADSDSYSYKNTNKTANDFKSLLNVDTCYGVYDGINSATDFMLSDFIIILLIFIICDILISADRTINIVGLFKVSKNGKLRIIIGKMLAAVSATIIVCALFYGANIAVSFQIYETGSLFKSIQSVPGFQNCILKINVIQYLILFIFSKILVMSAICLAVIFVFMVSKSKIGGYLILIFALVVFAAMYSLIEENSWCMALKYINPVALIDTKNVIGSYLNINILGNPINYITMFLVVSVISFLIFVLLNSLVFVRKTKWSYDIHKENKIFKLKTPLEKTGVARHEAYKIFVINKMAWLLVFVIAFQIFTVFYSPIKLNDDEKYQKFYCYLLEGDFTEKKTDEVMSLIENAGSGEEATILQSDILPYLDYLHEQNQLGKKVSVVFDGGYKNLLGIDGDESDIYTLLLYILIIVVSVPLFTNDYEIKTIPLLCSTKTGIKKINAYKLMCALISTLLLNVVVYLPFAFRISSSYGFRGGEKSVCSILEFQNFNDEFSIIHIVLISFAIRLIVSLIAVVIIHIISQFTKSTLTSFIASTIIFVIPLLLPLSEINVLNNYSLYHFQTFGKLLIL